MEKMPDKDACPICLGDIEWNDRIWCCPQCSKQAHIGCMAKWINKQNMVFQNNIVNYCPACKYQQYGIPPEYYCNCGRVKNPSPNRQHPHTCGNICNKKLPNCTHFCDLPCHKGKCQTQCLQMVHQKCECGLEERFAQCRLKKRFFCQRICDKVMECGVHRCRKRCQEHPCGECKEEVPVFCLCGKNATVRACNMSGYGFRCVEVCGLQLKCGNHTCKLKCHGKGYKINSCSECEKCPLRPNANFYCFCGESLLPKSLNSQRKSCLDPVTTKKCMKVCEKKYQTCSHFCKENCQVGECPPCKELVPIYCRCKKQYYQTECHKAQRALPFTCDQYPKHAKACGRHFCKQVCCDQSCRRQRTKKCNQTCGRSLNCGNHKCQMACHEGECFPCFKKIEYYCPCGKQNQGKNNCRYIPKVCDGICDKIMRCGHKCKEKCHLGDCKCEERSKLPCKCGKTTIDALCGEQLKCQNLCDKELKCGHKCMLRCHDGECLIICNKVCGIIKKKCGHQCQAMCHRANKDCSEDSCQANVQITCKCGNLRKIIKCQDEVTLECHRGCQCVTKFKENSQNRPLYFAPELIELCRKEPDKIKYFEQKICSFLRTGKQNIVISSTLTKFYKEEIRMLLFSHYKLSCSFVFSSHQSMDMHINLLPASQLPEPTLTTWVGANHSSFLQPSFQSSITIQNAEVVVIKDLIDELCEIFPEDLPYLHWKHKEAALYFWDQSQCEKCYKHLKLKFRHARMVIEVNRAEKNVDIKKKQVCEDDVVEIIKSIDQGSADKLIKFVQETEENSMSISCQEWILRAVIVLEAMGKITESEIVPELLKKLIDNYEEEIALASKQILGRKEPIKELQECLEDEGIFLSINEPEFSGYAILNNIINENLRIEIGSYLNQTEHIQQINNLAEQIFNAKNMDSFFSLIENSNFMTGCFLVKLYPFVVNKIMNLLPGKKFKESVLLGVLGVNSLSKAEKFLSCQGFSLKKQKNTLEIQFLNEKKIPYKEHDDKMKGILKDKTKDFFEDDQNKDNTEPYPLSSICLREHMTEDLSFIRNLIRKMKIGQL